jgi:hypothetical protein
MLLELWGENSSQGPETGGARPSLHWYEIWAVGYPAGPHAQYLFVQYPLSDQTQPHTSAPRD